MSKKDLSIKPLKEAPDEDIHKPKLDPILFGYKENGFKPFLLTIHGVVRSGKSVLVSNLLLSKNFKYKDLFKQVYYISPTIRNDASGYLVRDNDDIIIIDEGLEDLDLLMETMMEQQKEEVEANRLKPKKHRENQQILIILDDMLGLFKSRGGYFNSLLSKYRHYQTSLIITTQSFKMISTIQRYNSGFYILFKTFNNKERENVIEELSGSYENFEKYYLEATDKKHDFLYCNLESGKLFHNFDKLLYDENNKNKNEK